MKNYLIKIASLLLFTCLCHYANAQFNGGIKGGMSIPNLSSGSDNNPVSTGYSSRFGAAAAIFVEYELSRKISLQTQLEYSAQGGKKNRLQAIPLTTEMKQLFPEGQAPDYLYADYKSVARLNYLMLPVLVKFNFYLSKHYSFYLDAGPFASYLLNAKNITSGFSSLYLDEKGTQPLPGTEQSFAHTENVTGDLYRMNTGIEGNAGLTICTSIGNFIVEAGGNYGFKNIQKNSENGKNHTGAASVMLGYSIPIIGKGFLYSTKCTCKRGR